MTNAAIPSERLVVIRRDVLELLPWAVPAPGPRELRVRVAYSAVSFGDVMLRRHVFQRRPRVAVPGYEVSVDEASAAALILNYATALGLLEAARSLTAMRS